MTRWRIKGTFTTTSPMHVGSGAITTNPDLLNEKNGTNCDVQAVVKDYRRKPCIPGTAIKGVLRAWAEANIPGNPALERIFGHRDSNNKLAESGWANFYAAPIRARGPHDYSEHAPYWNEETHTGIASHVAIDRKTGAAEANKLFFEEFVPEGIEFDVEIDTTKLSEDDMTVLLAVLEQGSKHETQPFQFGANGADGWGRMKWNGRIEKHEKSTDKYLDAQLVAKAIELVLNPAQKFDLSLQFHGPFLVNDASKCHREKDDGLPNFVCLKKSNGQIWLPASSFRGTLRSRFEFLANSRMISSEAKATTELIFGSTGRSTRLHIEEFNQIDGSRTLVHQDFVAIDRFTGGAADGAKFDALYADRPTFKTRLTIDTQGLESKDEALIAAALHDVLEGRLSFGFGGSKGYGAATGTLCQKEKQWINSRLKQSQLTSTSKKVVAESINENLIDGVLVIVPTTPPNFSYTLKFAGSKGKNGDRVARDLVSLDLHGNVDQNETIEVPVQFVDKDSKPTRIRKAGELFQAPATVAASSNTATNAVRVDDSKFYNPYYFINLKDRSSFTGEIGDREPTSHAAYETGKFSGTIRVKMTTKTPLLLCEDEVTARVEQTDKGEHKVYGVRLDADGKPLLASSSVRGMLRSAYEAITNSRFGVFPTESENGHHQLLGFRPSASSGLSTIPVRIEDVNGKLQARVLSGTTQMGPDGRPRSGDPVPAACIAMYDQHWTLPNVKDVQHGRKAWAFIGPWVHERFRFWNVEAIQLGEKEPNAPPDSSRFRSARRSAGPGNWAEPRWVQGWICVNERNIDGKHDERFFFELDPTASRYAVLGASAAANWTRLIEDYQNQHAEEMKRGIKRPPALKPFCRFSRHISHDLKTVALDERQLKDGTLAYATVKVSGSSLIVTALYPVMITRKLFENSPLDLLPEKSKLRPATNRFDLSPADRVFGWVSQDSSNGKEPAHRSQVRFGVVTCTSDAAVDNFNGRTKTLAILGQPKPAQGRFYVGKADGSAQENGENKEKRGYTGSNRLRGPKVYPHYKLGIQPTAYSTEKSNQNRSITGWVKPDKTFEFDLHVTNLSKFELGALLWLLELPPEHFLRLGLAKPLGFGSVRLEVVSDKTVIADGAEWTNIIGTNGQPNCIDWKSTIADFEATMTQSNATLLKSFRKSAAGFTKNHPICYPPAQPGVRPQAGAEAGGQHYQWFTANEREGRDAGQKLCLPDLHHDEDDSIALPAVPRA